MSTIFKHLWRLMQLTVLAVLFVFLWPVMLPYYLLKAMVRSVVREEINRSR
jgi:hypothetical protein